MSYLNYSPDILERIDQLSKRFLDKNKVCEEFLYVLQERAELEEYYSRNLEKQAENLNCLLNGKEIMKETFNCLRNFFIIQAEQSRAFARSIKNDVIESLRNLLRQKAQDLKGVQTLGKRHEREMKQNMDQFDSLRRSYMNVSRQLEIEGQNSNTVNEVKYREKQSTETQFKDFINVYNKYIEDYFTDIAKVNDAFKEFEVQRNDNLKDAIMKFLVYEISLVRNLQYDVDRISTKIEEIDSKSEISEILKEPPSTKPLLCKINFENYKYYMDFTITKGAQSLAPQSTLIQAVSSSKQTATAFQQQQQSIAQQNETVRAQSIQQSSGLQQGGMQQAQQYSGSDLEPQQQKEKVQSYSQYTPQDLFVKLLSKARNGQEINRQQIDTLKTFLNTSTDRENFAMSLSVVFLSPQQATEQNQYELASESYTQLMKLLYSMLETCQNDKDINPILKVLSHSRKLYKQIQLPDEDKVTCEKITLFEGLQGHPLFSNQNFWSSTIKNTLQRALKAYKNVQAAQVMDGGEEAEMSEQEFLQKEMQQQIKQLFKLCLDRKRIHQYVQVSEGFLEPQQNTILHQFIDSFDDTQLWSKEDSYQLQMDQQQQQQQLQDNNADSDVNSNRPQKSNSASYQQYIWDGDTQQNMLQVNRSHRPTNSNKRKKIFDQLDLAEKTQPPQDQKPLSTLNDINQNDKSSFKDSDNNQDIFQ